MPNEITENEIRREFEMERLILFSDAVFAIAITLLVIDIKLPEIPENLEGVNFRLLLKPTLFEFLSFALSFFFIGMFWSRHLRLCRFLVQYDNGLIFRNLLLLFFIVIFPFSAGSLALHASSHFLLPFYLYLFNIFGCAAAFFILVYYVFHQKPALARTGMENEKKYVYLSAKYTLIMLLATFTVAFVVQIITGNTLYVAYSFYIMPVMAIYTRRRLRKLKRSAGIV